MFHRIVVPLDGSALAERALEWATDLARVANVPIHLVRVIDLGRIDGGASLVWGLSPWALERALDEEQRAACEYLERTRQRLKDPGRGGVRGGAARQGARRNRGVGTEMTIWSSCRPMGAAAYPAGSWERCRVRRAPRAGASHADPGVAG